MKGIRMQGGIPLQGKVRIQGSKNAALPILAATLLTNEVSYIQNCPRIADVHRFVHLLRELGCLVHWQEKGIRVQPGENEELPCERAEDRRMQGEAITGMRSSLCLLGALLGRCGYVTMEHPGGCVIGERPIDLHIRALQQMGVEFREEEGLLSAQVKDGKMHGAEITLEFPSVGATENILLAAVKADGDTRILGAAREPEVTALCEFLTACGAQIEGIGGSELLVHGDRPLHSTRYTVHGSGRPDRSRDVSVRLYRLRRQYTFDRGSLGADGSGDLCGGKNGCTVYCLGGRPVRTVFQKAAGHTTFADWAIPGVPHGSAVGGNGGADESGRMQLH